MAGLVFLPNFNAEGRPAVIVGFSLLDYLSPGVLVISVMNAFRVDDMRLTTYFIVLSYSYRLPPLWLH